MRPTDCAPLAGTHTRLHALDQPLIQILRDSLALGRDSGLIFKSGDPIDLRAKLSDIKSNKNGVQQLAHKARERVHSIYSWKTIAKNLNALYNELMQYSLS